MTRVATTRNPTPYQFFGTFAGLPFWPGGLTLLAAAPGIGKTSWLLRMLYEASVARFPSAIGCYEHTTDELKYRLKLQSQVAITGPHDVAELQAVEDHLALAGQAILLELSSQDDTVRGIEERLLMDFDFPRYGPALLAVDYIQRIPVIGLSGLLPEDQRAGEAAAQLRSLARRHGWTIVAACAIRAEHFSEADSNLSVLLGDERLPYEADRVLLLTRSYESLECGCFDLTAHTLKDRTGPIHTWQMQFWGARFYPAIGAEVERHRESD